MKLREDDFNYAIKINLEELMKRIVRDKNNNLISDFMFDNYSECIKHCFTLLENKRNPL